MPTCPRCAEDVRDGATMCPHCRKRLGPPIYVPWGTLALVGLVVALVAAMSLRT